MFFCIIFESMKALENPKWIEIALMWTKDKCLADDLFQETCLQVLESSSKIESPDNYIFVTMYRIWHDKHRRFKDKFCPRDYAEFEMVEDEEVHDHRLRLLENALDRYDDLDAALLGCWASGMTYREIGSKAGVSYRTVHERVRRTKDDLRRLL